MIFHYGFHEDALWRIDIYGMFPNMFDGVVATMETKYGQAAVSKHAIQNRMGATFEDGAAIWKASNGVIAYTKYSDRLDEPLTLRVYSTDGWKAIESTLHRKAQDAQHDM